MPRYLTVAAAQLGPIARTETESQAVNRVIAMLRDVHGRGRSWWCSRRLR